MQDQMRLIDGLLQDAAGFVVGYAFQALAAVIILGAGFLVARWVQNALMRVLEKRDVDVTLRQFISSAIKLLVLILFVMVAINKLGINITPLIAAVGGLALGASFAIQGPVANYGAGLVIILTRMFRVDDTITLQGRSGIVTDISLSATHLASEDGEQIVIPNKHVVGEIYRNSRGNRIVEGRLRITYGSDPERAIARVREVLDGAAGVHSEHPPQVGIEAFEPSAMVIGYRYWAASARYFAVQYAVNLGIFRALSGDGIGLDVPQRVRLSEGSD